MVRLFDADQLAQCSDDERGFTWVSDRPVQRIGYATNLTPEVAAEAIEHGVDLVLTHHDAWPFLFGMRERCLDLLRPQGISHCFFHAPLDRASFGTCASLTRRLGLRVTDMCLPYQDTVLCGHVGEPEQPMELSAMQALLEEVLGEPVRAWQNNNSAVHRACVLPGGALMTDHVKHAVDQGCDVYITGEKVLYTVQYARFAGINPLVGSHTATELPGVEELARKVARGCGVEAVRLTEAHAE